MKCSKYIILGAVAFVSLLAVNYGYQTYAANKVFASSRLSALKVCPDIYIINNMPGVVYDEGVLYDLHEFVATYVTDVRGAVLSKKQSEYIRATAGGVYSEGGYFDVDGTRKNVEDLDLGWVSQNCVALTPSVVY